MTFTRLLKTLDQGLRLLKKSKTEDDDAAELPVVNAVTTDEKVEAKPSRAPPGPLGSVPFLGAGTGADPFPLGAGATGGAPLGGAPAGGTPTVVTVAVAVADSSMKPAIAAPKVLPLASLRLSGSFWTASREDTSKIWASFL